MLLALTARTIVRAISAADMLFAASAAIQACVLNTAEGTGKSCVEQGQGWMLCLRCRWVRVRGLHLARVDSEWKRVDDQPSMKMATDFVRLR